MTSESYRAETFTAPATGNRPPTTDHQLVGRPSSVVGRQSWLKWLLIGLVVAYVGVIILAPLLAPDAYRMRTAAVASGGAASFIPSGKVIDHILTSVALDGLAGDRAAVIPPLDEQFPGYLGTVSDHLPVVLSIPGP